ncbi:hypothetical protein EVAR_20688_1 [Eumeta japonica]|uniref:Uncharacterized protein n=1 Tax=Eumeta variegata TaxID=151549 RepID=A0A4C1VCH6_EUMVA|nr:hypothetical protein EVAR_20688_1 [Eumeta japonica]
MPLRPSRPAPALGARIKAAPRPAPRLTSFVECVSVSRYSARLAGEGSMEARFVTCRSVQQLKPPEKSLAPPPVPTARGLLSRFGSQAQALFAPKKPRFGSSVAIHKLRETKWFKHDEQNILCAVLESGFILEVRAEEPLPPGSALSPDYHMYAIAMWKKGKEKTKNPEQIEVYTVQQKGVRKRIIKCSLSAFWKKDSVIRINNVDDKQETPNGEKDIRAKLDMATKSRFERNWHNTLHFVHWCRYGETPQEARMRQVSHPCNPRALSACFDLNQKSRTDSCHSCLIYRN